jgi:hypothetical protein
MRVFPHTGQNRVRFQFTKEISSTTGTTKSKKYDLGSESQIKRMKRPAAPNAIRGCQRRFA